jgi:hypothetical protein
MNVTDILVEWLRDHGYDILPPELVGMSAERVGA